jgi:hypothetical protein
MSFHSLSNLSVVIYGKNVDENKSTNEKMVVSQSYMDFICFLGWIQCLVFWFGGQQKVETTTYFTLTGSILSFFYFIQKQGLEETQLFKELFNSFNARYDKLNGDLNTILKKDKDEPFEEKEQEVLNDYFNLCAEEYLYFKREYIDLEVWQAWCNGMWFFLQNERICKVWEDEEKTGSYYGLTISVIRKYSSASK